MPPTNADWNPRLYDSSHAFVWEFGRALISLLDPKPSEQILDIGSGTGHLTSEIAASGARVLGIDRSPSMTTQARANFPDLRFETLDVSSFPMTRNSTPSSPTPCCTGCSRPNLPSLPWREPSNQAGESYWNSEGTAIFRSSSTPPTMRYATRRRQSRALQSLVLPEHSGVFLAAGSPRNRSHLYPPVQTDSTPLQDGERGLQNWYRMFGANLMSPLPDAAHADFHRLTAEFAAPRLLRDGSWTADYRRIRVAGSKR